MKRELTILLVEHDMEAVFALADRITVLVYGRVIASGAPAEIRANAEVRDAYLGEAGGGSCLTPVLEVADVETCYGLSQVLFGVSLRIAPGEMVTLMGRNGMGKTTTVRSIMGLTPARAGRIRFVGHEIRGLPSYKIAQLGIGLVPEGRQIFPNLTVRENLVATAVARDGGMDAGQGLRAVPAAGRAAASMGNQLSGGEQQMLAIGRALMTNPRLLILDEATEGLAPLIRAEIWRCLAQLKAAGLAILVIDKNVDALTRVADRHFLIERGRVVWTRRCRAELAAAPEVQHRYLGV